MDAQVCLWLPASQPKPAFHLFQSYLRGVPRLRTPGSLRTRNHITVTERATAGRSQRKPTLSNRVGSRHRHRFGCYPGVLGRCRAPRSGTSSSHDDSSNNVRRRPCSPWFRTSVADRVQIQQAPMKHMLNGIEATHGRSSYGHIAIGRRPNPDLFQALLDGNLCVLL
jgi:hypothetical protein